MARKLKTFVTAHERDDKGELTGVSGTFGPDDDLSKPENSWVEKAITNPDVWDDGEDKASSAGKADSGDKAAPTARRSTK
jgi:hypothetical protein